MQGFFHTDNNAHTCMVETTSTDSSRTLHHRYLERASIHNSDCPNCGGALRIIAAPSAGLWTSIEDPSVIVTILSHLGLPTRAPPRAPARQSIYSR